MEPEPAAHEETAEREETAGPSNTRQRVRDHFVGAGIALLLVAGFVGGLLWAVSSPAGEAGPAGTPAVPGGASSAPPDLAEGETWLGDVVLDAGTVATPDARLLDVSATGRDVLASAGGLTAGALDVDATVPFDVVGEQLGGGSTVAAAGGDEASVTRSVEFAGREIRVVATGTVEVVDGRIVVEPTSIDVGGPDFLARAAAAAVRRFVTIEQDVEGLPDGLVLQDVEVVDAGFRATLSGTDVSLVQ